MTKVEHTKIHEIPLRLLPTMHGLVATRPRTTALVADAELVSVEEKLLTVPSIQVNGRLVKPILISYDEKIEVGDWVYQNRGNGDLEIFQIKNEYTIARDIQKKILVLPEHFSPQQLQDIVDGKLKEGKCLVECERGEEIKVTETDSKGKAEKWNHLKATKIKLNPHITIYPVEEKMYTERELEISYCIGLLNRMLTMEELSIELKTAQDKINRLKESIKRGDFNPR